MMTWEERKSFLLIVSQRRDRIYVQCYRKSVFRKGPLERELIGDIARFLFLDLFSQTSYETQQGSCMRLFLWEGSWKFLTSALQESSLVFSHIPLPTRTIPVEAVLNVDIYLLRQTTPSLWSSLLPGLLYLQSTLRQFYIWSSHRSSAVTNLTRIHEDAGLIPGLTQWVKGSGIAMSCGVGQRQSSDLMLLWLWCRPAAAAPI